MDLNDYTRALDQYVFEEWIDIPFDFEHKVQIIALYFFKNEIPFKYACSFAQLIIDIETKLEFDYTLVYEPFNILDNGTDDDWMPACDPKVNFESFEIIIDGEKRIDISYTDNLNFKEFLKKVKEQDLPSN